MFETDPQQVQEALRLLKITGRPDKPTVIRAFRDAAKEVHPDKFRTEAEKAAAHPKFLKLVAARDLCLQALDEQVDGGAQTAAASGGSTARPPRERPAAQPERPDYRAEWEAFATNQHAYFNAMTAIKSARKVALQAVQATVVATLYAAVMTIVIALIGGLLAGAFFAAGSATIAIPVAGWILGWSALVALVGFAEEGWRETKQHFRTSAQTIFRSVAITGRATLMYHGIFIPLIVAFAGVSLAMFSYEYDSDSPDSFIFFWFLTALGCLCMSAASLLTYLIILVQIREQLRALDAAFRRLREAPSFALVLAPRPQQRR